MTNQREKDLEQAKQSHHRSAGYYTGFADGAEHGRKELAARIEKIRAEIWPSDAHELEAISDAISEYL